MAQPFLGKNYGDTSRTTPARLLGGTPESSSQAPIGTSSLAQPALQVVQQIADTFSRPGQGPTVGGPAVLPTPPQVFRGQAPIPASLPRPVEAPFSRTQMSVVGEQRVLPTVVNEPKYAPYVNNMAALAGALSTFSPFFEALQLTTNNRERVVNERAKIAGDALAQQASQVGMFSSLQELQKALEKGAGQGLAGYDQLLQRFQAADPRALRYASIGLQDSYIKSNAATLKERVSQTKTLLDGRPLESVPANDPEFQRLTTALMFPNGTMGIMPEVFEANRQQLTAIYGSASSDQEKRYAGYKTQKAKQGLAAVQDGNAMALVNGSLPLEQIAANLTNGLHGFYNESGQTSDEYQKEKEGFAKGFVKSVLAASAGDWGKAKLALARVPEVIAQVQAGPMDANGKAPLLLDQIGGMAGLYEITKELQEQVISQQNLNDNLDGRQAKEQVEVDIKNAFTPEVLADPAKIDMVERTVLARGRQLYGNNPEMALAYEEAVKKHTSGIRTGYVQPVQEQNEVNLWAQMAQNPSVDFTGRIMQLQRSQQISYSAAKSFLSTQASRNREDNKANYQVLRGLQDDLKKRLETQYARGGSKGGANLTPNEARQLWQTLGELYKSGDDLIRKAPGQDVTKQLGDLYGNALSKSMPQQTQQAPAGATPEGIAKGLAPGARGNPSQNNQLRRQIETQPLYAKERMGQQLDGILQGRPLDNATRQIIRRSGLKPSEFFSRQMQLHGVPLDSDTQKRLQELDGGDLVSQVPAAPNPYATVASRMGMQFANSILNAIAPPAAAAERGVAPFTANPVAVTGGFGGLLGVLRSGEGGWNSVNRGRTGDSSPMQNLTSTAIGVIEDMQRRGRVFAVGAYQFTPGVLARARREAGLSPNALMTPTNQNAMATALILGSKRPALADYIRGKSNDLNAAHLDIASEWASLQAPNGRGVYDGDSAGNMASVSAATVRAALKEARRAYLLRQRRS